MHRNFLKMSRKISIVLSVCAAVALVVFVSCNRTKTVKVQRKAITEAVYASGFIVPKNQYKVYAMSDGYIVSVLKEAGDNVSKNEAILQVQNDVASAKYSSSMAAYELAKLNASDNSPVLADVRNKLKNADAKLKNDSLNFARYKTMYDAGAVTKAQFDQNRLAYEVSQNDYNSAIELLKKTREQLQVEWKSAQSSMVGAGFDASNFLIKSMMDGVVYDVTKKLGEAVRKNDVVAVIGEKGQKILELSVDQQDISRIKLNQEVVVKLDVTGNAVFKARISKIYPNMNQSDQSFRVDAVFEGDADLAFANASVEANIIISKKESALVIPKEVVLPGNEVELAGISKARKKIKTGIESLELVEVIDGLTETDEIVIPTDKK